MEVNVKNQTFESELEMSEHLQNVDTKCELSTMVHLGEQVQNVKDYVSFETVPIRESLEIDITPIR